MSYIMLLAQYLCSVRLYTRNGLYNAALIYCADKKVELEILSALGFGNTAGRRPLSCPGFGSFGNLIPFR